MPYLNLDDNFADHPKIDALSDGAFRLHVAGMNYCARKLTDGVIEKHRVHRLMPVYKPGFLRELLSENIWLTHPSGYEVRDYLDWNKSKAWWDERRENEAKRIAKWRAKNTQQNDGSTP